VYTAVNIHPANFPTMTAPDKKQQPLICWLVDTRTLWPGVKIADSVRQPSGHHHRHLGHNAG
jgi:hypothetical protein